MKALLGGRLDRTVWFPVYVLIETDLYKKILIPLLHIVFKIRLTMILNKIK